MIETAVKDKVLYITLNNPPVNVINIALMEELTKVLQNTKSFL